MTEATKVPKLTATLLSEVPAEAVAQERPLLVVGPSLGTSVTALWGSAAPHLADAFTLVGWDLPGHGRSAPAQAPLSISELAAGVIELELEVSRDLGIPAHVPRYAAGVSVAGAVTLTLGLNGASPFSKLAAICTAARIGEPDDWRARADLAARAGTPTMVEGSAKRWFAPGFLEDHPERATPLLHCLQQADRYSYADICRALADYDLRDRLCDIAAPVLALAGGDDEVCPPDLMDQIAQSAPYGSLAVLSGVAHQAPAESPEETAQILKEFFNE